MFFNKHTHWERISMRMILKQCSDNGSHLSSMKLHKSINSGNGFALKNRKEKFRNIAKIKKQVFKNKN